MYPILFWKKIFIGLHFNICIYYNLKVIMNRTYEDGQNIDNKRQEVGGKNGIN